MPANLTEKYMKLAGMKVPQTPIIWLGWIICLPFLVPGVLESLRTQRSLLLLGMTLGSEGIFVLFYAWGTWLNARDIKRLRLEEYQNRNSARWPFVLYMALLSCAVAYLASLSRVQMMSPFVFTAAYVAGTLRPQKVVAIVNGALAAVSVGLDGALNGTFYCLGVFLIIVVSVFAAGWDGVFILAQQLDAAQAEIESLAVNAERLRIARDLHDLLGQKLSIIVLKSQVGRKLVRQNLENAEREMAEVEQTARVLLQEVRQTVARYGRPTVAEEIKLAREILLAAGIEFVDTSKHDAVRDLPESIDEVLAWVIREGVTNVVRHSQARTCHLCLDRNSDVWTLEIFDHGGPLLLLPEKGNGMKGLESRVASAAGRCEIALQPDGGLRLFVEIPVFPKGQAS
jgi:two-component system sensor histidine kinase DesK